MEESGAIEKKSDIEKGEDGVVKRWLLELEAANKQEDRWQKDATVARKVYAREEYVDGDFAKRKETFNILWSNTETIRPALYNSTPRPDVRRRYRDKDPLGKAVAEVCERAASYTLDCQDFDAVMIQAVNDMLLDGRAITRIRYVPSFRSMDEDSKVNEPDTDETPEGDDEPQLEVVYEEIKFEKVDRTCFRRGPGKTWEQVPWIGFLHKLTKDQVEEKFPDFVDKVGYDVNVNESEEKETRDENEKEHEVFKRCKVWEIWDKEKKEVIFFAPSYKDKVLHSEPDPLKLRDFWPIPQPLYAIENSDSLVPATPYSMYETLALELEKVTNRIRKILDGLRLRGIYDSRVGELESVFEAFDNEFKPATDLAALLEIGGLEKAIWTLPIDMYAKVLQQLYEYRQGLIHQIYEVTGISDIIRGDTNPNETLGAQQIKAQFGSQRLQRQQKAVQRYARDLIRMTIELIGERFSVETIQLMTGLQYPTLAQKQQIQAQLQMEQQMAQRAQVIARQTGQQLPPPQSQVSPQQQALLQLPSWDEIKRITENDFMRDFRVDIETDSTIEAEQQKDQQNITELLTGITNFMQSVAEPIQSGVMTVDVAKAMLLAAVRRFRLGRQVEDAIESIEQPQQQGPQGVDPAEVEKQVQQIQQKYQQQADKQVAEAQAKLNEECAAYKQKCDMEKKALEESMKLAERERNLENERKLFELQKKLQAAEDQLIKAKDDAELKAAVEVYKKDV